MIYRILNDFELERYHYESRTADSNWMGLNVAPETCGLTDGNPPTRVFNIRRIRYNTQAQKFCDSMNTASVNRYLHTPSVGLNVRWPIRMTITTGNNFVDILNLDASGLWGRVKTYPLAGPFPKITKQELAVGDYDKSLIHIFHTINALGHIGGCPKGVAWYPLISDVPVWVDMGRVVKV